MKLKCCKYCFNLFFKGINLNSKVYCEIEKCTSYQQVNENESLHNFAIYNNICLIL